MFQAVSLIPCQEAACIETDYQKLHKQGLRSKSILFEHLPLSY